MPNTIYRNKRAVLDLHLLTDKELVAAYEAIKRELLRIHNRENI